MIGTQIYPQVYECHEAKAVDTQVVSDPGAHNDESTGYGMKKLKHGHIIIPGYTCFSQAGDERVSHGAPQAS